jgi:pimeloyl-ACP methyl ester carboxylesterase
MIVEVDGATLNYDVHGEGEPLLWLHGFTGAGSDWRYVFAEPPSGYRLIAPDLRGHGRSSNPSDEFRFGDAARDVLGLLEHLGLSAVKAIGLSGGGITLLHMATMQPGSIARMVVVSAPPYYPEQARAIQRVFSPQMLPEQELALMPNRHVGGQEQVDRLFSYARRFADDYDDVRFDEGTLRTITAETLIVFGDRDPLYPVSLAFELYRNIPKAYLWVVPNGSHGPIFGTQAAAFTTTSLAFLGGAWRDTGPRG